MWPPSTASPGLTKTVALEVATHGITANCISPGYVWTPLVERQIPDTMKARKLTKEQVINDVLLEAQPTKQFVTVGTGRGARRLPARMRRARSRAPTCPWMAAGPREGFFERYPDARDDQIYRIVDGGMDRAITTTFALFGCQGGGPPCAGT